MSAAVVEAAGAPLLEARGLGKVFGAQAALRGVDLALHPGEIHALVGENGAGKSTLIRLLTGVQAPDAGELRWAGQPLTLAGPQAARRLGIRVIHQDRQLVPAFTALENLYLGERYPLRRGGLGVDWRRMRAEAQRAQAALGLDLPLDRLAAELTPTQQTLLELLRATLRDGRLLVFDEPSAALTDAETALLFWLMARLQAAGTALLYVSHRLDEVLRLADRITVLRGGERVASVRRGELDRAGLVARMSGQAAAAERPARPRAATGAPLLEVRGLSTRDGAVREVGFSARAGEIVGVFGLAGAGRTELLEAIYGLRPGTGEVRLLGERLSGPRHTPAAALRRGLVLIPEDRRGRALMLGLNVRENLTLPLLARHSRLGLVRPQAERRAVRAGLQALDVRARGPEQPIAELSGGNQQKLVFARALALDPQVWLCDEPTQAVDEATRLVIHALLRDQARRGRAVVCVCSDLPELLELADRVVVLRAGRVVADLAQPGPDGPLSAAQVLQVCYGAPAPSAPGPQEGAHAPA